MKEQFRGVVWPREPTTDTNGKPAYRYVIVGMLVTDTPIEGLHPNETVIDGPMERYVSEWGIAGALERAPKFGASGPLGDASAVLRNLENIVGEPYQPTKKAAKQKATKD